MKKILCFYMLWIGIHFVHGQTTPVNIEMSETVWEIPEGAQFEDFDGRKTLVMKGAGLVSKTWTLPMEVSR